MTAIRWSRAWLLLPLAVAFSVYVSLVQDVGPPGGYSIGLAATVSDSAKVIAPMTAAALAWHARQLVEYLSTGRNVRRNLTSLGRMLWPLPVAGLLAFAVSAGVQVTLLGESPLQLLRPSALWVLAPVVLVLLGHAALGAALGSRLPLPVGAPIVGAASHLWLTWPPALGTAWPRQLTGLPVGCCELDSLPNPDARTVGATVALIWIVGSLLVLAIRPRRAASDALVLAVVVVALLVGSLTARSNGAASAFILTSQRPDVTICAERDAERPVVCLWPELRSELPRAQALAAAAYEDWAPYDIPRPARLSTHSAAEETPLGYRLGLTDDQVRLSVASYVLAKLVPRDLICSDEAAGIRAWSDREVLLAWLALRARVPAAGLTRQGFDPTSISSAQRLASDEAQDQTTWFTTAVTRLGSCR